MTLGYDRRGSGEPLVLLHGLGTDRHIWRPVIERIEDRRDLIAIDMPGFGDSPLNANGDVPAPALLARRIASFLRHDLGLDSVHVAGNSLGGWVAMELALAGYARSVTAIAPAGLWSRPLGPKPAVARKIARAAAPVLALALAGERGRRLALSGTMAHPERVPRADALEIVRAYAKSPGYVEVNNAMRAGRFEGLDRIDVPLTFGWPEYDRLVGRPRRLPAGSTSVVLHDCGHVPMWDDPDQVAALLLQGSGAG